MINWHSSVFAIFLVKMKNENNTTWIFIFQIYGIFWSILIDHFIYVLFLKSEFMKKTNFTFYIRFPHGVKRVMISCQVFWCIIINFYCIILILLGWSFIICRSEIHLWVFNFMVPQPFFIFNNYLPTYLIRKINI